MFIANNFRNKRCPALKRLRRYGEMKDNSLCTMVRDLIKRKGAVGRWSTENKAGITYLLSISTHMTS